MEPEGSLPHSQEPATCPCPEPDQSTSLPHPTSWRYILILSSHLRLALPSALFPSGFRIKTLYELFLSPIRNTCPNHLILLDLITLIMFDEDYRSICSLFCSLLHSRANLLLRPSLAQISSSAANFQTPSAYVPPSIWTTKFHTHTKQQAKL